MTEKRDVQLTIKCQCDGFAFDLGAELAVDHIPGLMKKLRAAGVEPAQSPYLWSQAQGDSGGSVTTSHAATSGTSPVCPLHGRPMKPSKFPNGGHYCTAKNPDGSYCSESTKAA